MKQLNMKQWISDDKTTKRKTCFDSLKNNFNILFEENWKHALKAV